MLKTKQEIQIIFGRIGKFKRLRASPKNSFLLQLANKIKKITLQEAEYTIKEIVKILPDPSVVKVGVACPEYHVLKMAKEDNIKLIITGLGSEEIFAGYERHKLAGNLHEECWNGLKQIYERDLSRDLAIFDYFKTNPFCPFLDKELIAYSMQIHPELKIKRNINKYILRQTAIFCGLKKSFALRPKLAAQYGSGFHKAIDKLSRKNKFKYKKDYLNSLR